MFSEFFKNSVWYLPNFLFKGVNENMWSEKETREWEEKFSLI
jgi:hypothetical protein